MVSFSQVIDKPLCEHFLWWDIVEEKNICALIGTDMSYSGAFELSGVPYSCMAEGEISRIGVTLRKMIASFDDGINLLFLYKVRKGAVKDIKDYETQIVNMKGNTKFVADKKLEWLNKADLKTTSIYCYYTPINSFQNYLARSGNASPKTYKLISEKAHNKSMKQLIVLKNKLKSYFFKIGCKVRDFKRQDHTTLLFNICNPKMESQNISSPKAKTRWDNYTKKEIVKSDLLLKEPTFREQLFFEDLELHKDYMRQVDFYRRVMSLKVLPEDDSTPLFNEPFLKLSVPKDDGSLQYFEYIFAVGIQILNQKVAKYMLNAQHGLVDMIKDALPNILTRSVEKEEEDDAKQKGIKGIFSELVNKSNKLVNISVNILLQSKDLDTLDQCTEAVMNASGQMGQSKFIRNEMNQLDSFCSMLPVGSVYSKNKKKVTNENAADFIPIWSSHKGSDKAMMLLNTPDNELLRLHTFDKSLALSHHATLVGTTGGGKTVTALSLLLEFILSGGSVINVEKGQSAGVLAEFLGNQNIIVDLKTPICPFMEYDFLFDSKIGGLDPGLISRVVNYLGVCITDAEKDGFNYLEEGVVTSCVEHCYNQFRNRPDDKPLPSDFLRLFNTYKHKNPENVLVAKEIARRMEFLSEGKYEYLLNRPSNIKLDSNFVNFDLGGIPKDDLRAKEIALASLSEFILNRDIVNDKKTIVHLDEVWNVLNGVKGEKLIESWVRTWRKEGKAIWTTSQVFDDFISNKAGKVISALSTIKYFIWHKEGHGQISKHFKFNSRTDKAFRSLDFKPGYYSDFLLMYGGMTTVVRNNLIPLVYWLLTSDDDDKNLFKKTKKLNPHIDPNSLIKNLSNYFPNGAFGE